MRISDWSSDVCSSDLAPHLFEIVERAHFRSKEVDDDVARVEQHPVAALHAFRRDAEDALVLQLLAQMVGHGADLPGRAAGGDHHEVCDAGFVGEFDDDDVVRLVVFQGRLDHRRSEEHTSELQSLMRISYAVFCLKKKTINSQKNNHQTSKEYNIR